MEIKWGVVKGRFSHRSRLKKITSQQKGQAGRDIAAWSLPTTWEKALSNFNSQGFMWNSKSENGRGAILFCPSCQNATLFQIFNISGHLSDPWVLETLKSLGDHRNDDYTAWSIFDIHALLPKSFQRVRHTFKPGNHAIVFSDGSSEIWLYRWAPASALLAQATLSQFAASTLMLPQEQMTQISINSHPSVEWREKPRHHRFYRFKQKAAFRWVRVWHVRKKNRILGVRIHSKRPIERDQMADLCSHFKIRQPLNRSSTECRHRQSADR